MFDWIILGNLIISAAVGAVFGILGAMVQYRFDRKRDDIAWERKKEELLLQWEHEQRENRNREMRADMDVIFEQARQSFDGTPRKDEGQGIPMVLPRVEETGDDA